MVVVVVVVVVIVDISRSKPACVINGYVFSLSLFVSLSLSPCSSRSLVLTEEHTPSFFRSLSLSLFYVGHSPLPRSTRPRRPPLSPRVSLFLSPPPLLPLRSRLLRTPIRSHIVR